MAKRPKCGSGWWKAARRRVFERDGHKCRHCEDRRDLTIDHVVPLSAGGDNRDDNLQTLCDPCNLAKGSRDHVPDGFDPRAIREQMAQSRLVRQQAARRAAEIKGQPGANLTAAPWVHPYDCACNLCLHTRPH